MRIHDKYDPPLHRLELHVCRYSEEQGIQQHPGPVERDWFWQWAMDKAAKAALDSGLPVTIHYLFGPAIGGVVPPQI